MFNEVKTALRECEDQLSALHARYRAEGREIPHLLQSGTQYPDEQFTNAPHGMNIFMAAWNLIQVARNAGVTNIPSTKKAVTANLDRFSPETWTPEICDPLSGEVCLLLRDFYQTLCDRSLLPGWVPNAKKVQASIEKMLDRMNQRIAPHQQKAETFGHDLKATSDSGLERSPGDLAEHRQSHPALREELSRVFSGELDLADFNESLQLKVGSATSCYRLLSAFIEEFNHDAKTLKNKLKEMTFYYRLNPSIEEEFSHLQSNLNALAQYKALLETVSDQLQNYYRFIQAIQPSLSDYLSEHLDLREIQKFLNQIQNLEQLSISMSPKDVSKTVAELREKAEQLRGQLETMTTDIAIFSDEMTAALRTNDADRSDTDFQTFIGEEQTALLSNFRGILEEKQSQLMQSLTILEQITRRSDIENYEMPMITPALVNLVTSELEGELRDALVERDTLVAPIQEQVDHYFQMVYVQHFPEVLSHRIAMCNLALQQKTPYEQLKAQLQDAEMDLQALDETIACLEKVREQVYTPDDTPIDYTAFDLERAMALLDLPTQDRDKYRRNLREQISTNPKGLLQSVQTWWNPAESITQQKARLKARTYFALRDQNTGLIKRRDEKRERIADLKAALNEMNSHFKAEFSKIPASIDVHAYYADPSAYKVLSALNRERFPLDLHSFKHFTSENQAILADRFYSTRLSNTTTRGASQHSPDLDSSRREIVRAKDALTRLRHSSTKWVTQAKNNALSSLKALDLTACCAQQATVDEIQKNIRQAKAAFASNVVSKNLQKIQHEMKKSIEAFTQMLNQLGHCEQMLGLGARYAIDSAVIKDLDTQSAVDEMKSHFEAKKADYHHAMRQLRDKFNGEVANAKEEFENLVDDFSTMRRQFEATQRDLATLCQCDLSSLNMRANLQFSFIQDALKTIKQTIAQKHARFNTDATQYEDNFLAGMNAQHERLEQRECNLHAQQSGAFALRDKLFLSVNQILQNYRNARRRDYRTADRLYTFFKSKPAPRLAYQSSTLDKIYAIHLTMKTTAYLTSQELTDLKAELKALLFEGIKRFSKHWGSDKQDLRAQLRLAWEAVENNFDVDDLTRAYQFNKPAPEAVKPVTQGPAEPSIDSEAVQGMLRSLQVNTARLAGAGVTTVAKDDSGAGVTYTPAPLAKTSH